MMARKGKKKKKKMSGGTKFIITMLILVILVWGFVAIKYFDNLPVGGPSGTLMILSISGAQFTPGDTFYKAFVAVRDGAGESFKIAWTADDIKQYITDPYTIVEKGVYGDMYILKNERRWFTKAQNQAPIVYGYELLDGATFFCGGIPKCQEKYPNKNIVFGTSGSGECLCIAANTWGQYKYFDGTGERYWEIKAQFTGVGMSDTMNSRSKPTIALPVGCNEFGDDCKVKIYSVQASLDGLWSSSHPSSSVWFPLRVGQTTRLINHRPPTQTVDVAKNIDIGPIDFKSLICDFDGGGTIYSCFSNAGNCWDSETATDKCISAYENKRGTVFTDKTQQWIDTDLSKLATKAYWDGEALVVEEKPEVNQQIDLFVFDINAAWVGIQQVAGKPSLICPYNTQHLSAESSTWYGTIKNVGNSPGAFSLAIDCGGTTSSSVFPQSISLQSNQESSVWGTVTGEAIGGVEVTQQCSVSAWATAFPERTDLRASCNFYDTTKPHQAFCIANRNYCSDDAQSVCVCNSAGTAIDCPPTAGQTCPLGCEAASGGAQCKGCALKGYACTVYGTNEDSCCEGLKCQSNVCIKVIPKDPCARDCDFFDVKCWWDKALRKDCVCKATWWKGGMDYVWCKINNALGPLILILSIFGLIIGGVLSYDFLGGVLPSKKQKWTRGILAAILGIAVAYIIFTYFWLGVLLLVLYLGLKMIVGKFL